MERIRQRDEDGRASHHKAMVIVASSLLVGVAVGSGVIIAGGHNTAPQPSSTASGQSSPEASASAPRPSLTPEQCAARLPTDFLIGQTLMIGLNAADLNTEAPIFKQYNIGGAVIMTAPENPLDVSINRFKTTAGSHGVPVLTSTDEEGGQVQRFQNLGALPAPAEVASTMSTAQAEQMIYRHGVKLKKAGIDMVLGPLADVAAANSYSPLGDRIFSDNPSTVKAYDLAYIKGWRRAGILPTLKHFPGMGSATANTDYAPATTPPFSYLRQHDILPYMGMSGTGTAVMIGNQNVPGWFGGPASLSPVPNSYLRSGLGYKNNLVVTDALNAEAVTSGTPEPQAVADAIEAGNDIALVVAPGDGSDPTPLIGSLVQSLKTALGNGDLSRSQLAASTTRKLLAQNIQPCSLR